MRQRTAVLGSSAVVGIAVAIGLVIFMTGSSAPPATPRQAPTEPPASSLPSGSSPFAAALAKLHPAQLTADFREKISYDSGLPHGVTYSTSFSYTDRFGPPTRSAGTQTLTQTMQSTNPTGASATTVGWSPAGLTMSAQYFKNSGPLTCRWIPPVLEVDRSPGPSSSWSVDSEQRCHAPNGATSDERGIERLRILASRIVTLPGGMRVAALVLSESISIDQLRPPAGSSAADRPFQAALGSTTSTETETVALSGGFLISRQETTITRSGASEHTVVIDISLTGIQES